MRDATNVKLLYIRNLFAKNYEKIKESCVFGEKQYIQISPEEGKLLSLFIKINGIKRIVEVGTLYGYSSICMAKALPEDGHIYTIENNPYHMKIARDNFSTLNLINKITLLEGDACKKLKELSIKAPFDMIFIDADKGNYTRYLDWAELYIRQGGLIVADNTLLFNTIFLESPPEETSKCSWYAMKEFNNRLSNENKYHSILIPTEEGMTIALKL
ncbi:methyltransferase [Wolbachia pipientis]|uniref:Methyltransferase n=1 Tax=Wolbachia pipientis TaxID=955 RepID=A0A1E7QKC8_WOLPI|nr:O-methyltransferase [Wolbachia pipientis]OEY86935.1 methyltransferase [Wolbachia pipientis]